MDLKQLQAEHLTQRKARNKVATSVLSTMIAEVDKEQRNGNKVDIYGKVRKYIELNVQNLNFISDENTKKATFDEIEYLEGLLPSKLTDQEILNILEDNAVNSIKDAMYILKTEYAGKYDGKHASLVVREYLAR